MSAGNVVYVIVAYVLIGGALSYAVASLFGLWREMWRGRKH